MSFVKTLSFGSIVSPVLNLAFYFFNFSKTWKGDDRLMYLTQMPWPHNVHIHSPPRFLHSFSLMRPLQLQHTQTPLSSAFLNAVLDNGQFTRGRKTWMKWNMTGERAEFKYKYTSGHTLMPNKLSALFVVFMLSTNSRWRSNCSRAVSMNICFKHTSSSNLLCYKLDTLNITTKSKRFIPYLSNCMCM